MIGCRLIRRRSFLAVVFSCSLIYFIASIYKQSQASRRANIGTLENRPRFSLQDFRWQARPYNSSEDVCHNSVQGREILVDDKGFVCTRDKIAAGGCCQIENSLRYVCSTCQRNGCCAIFEHCVSCCLQPEKLSLIKRIILRMSNTFPYLFAPVTNLFEFCLTKCRTSSQSVLHENSYRNSVAKHCFSDRLPDIQLRS